MPAKNPNSMDVKIGMLQTQGLLWFPTNGSIPQIVRLVLKRSRLHLKPINYFSLE